LKGEKSIYREGFPKKRSGLDGNDANACWEECTGREGADADYCEGKILGATSSNPISIPLLVYQRSVVIMIMVMRAGVIMKLTTEKQELAS